MNIKEVREARQHAEELIQRAEVVLDDPKTLGPCRRMWQGTLVDARRELARLQEELCTPQLSKN